MGCGPFASQLLRVHPPLVLCTTFLKAFVPQNAQDAVAMVRAIPEADKAAKKLTEEALARGSNDNVSCIVVRFKQP
jgi:serine/threonine protein phosphatase PrpC